MPQLSANREWRPDVLGQGYRAITFEFESDLGTERPETATLIRAPKPGLWSRITGSLKNTDVLYVHGWSDYFFQTHVADFWRDRGANFFALDLRRYGRNLTSEPDVLPGYASSLETYDEEIEAALEAMGHAPESASGRKLILIGHSTGGLVLSLWAAKNPGRASALVLNSPWLELQTREIGRLAIAPFLDALSKYQPTNPFRVAEPGFYIRTVSKSFEGEWAINPEWHPDRSFPVYPGWLSAVTKGQQVVARGLNLSIPVLVLLSAKSIFSAVWDDEMKRADIVLDVRGIAQRSTDLGQSVTLVRINNAMHDVFLSEKQVRARAFDAIDEWLEGYGKHIASTGQEQVGGRK